MVLLDKAFFRLNGKLYGWRGWLGCQLESREWFRVPAGTERKLLGETFRVWSSDREGLKFATCWSLVGLSNDINEANERLRKFREQLARLI